MTRRLPLAALAALGLAALPAVAQSRVVSLTAADGASLSAAVYEPFHAPAPAVLLFHMLGRSRQDWDETAERLRRAGFFVLALDFRWIPASSTDHARDLRPLVQDARAALTWVKARDDVLASRIGIGGASLGASVATLIAGDDPDIRSLALVSASLDYRGLRAETPMRKFGDRHALLIAAASDPYAVRSTKHLAAGGPNRQVLITDVPGHGTVLLSRQPDLVDRLVDWFQRTLL